MVMAVPEILADPGVRALIDFGEPVGLLLVAVLHCLSDADQPWQVVATLRTRCHPAVTWGSATPPGRACRTGRPRRSSGTTRATSPPPRVGCARGPRSSA